MRGLARGMVRPAKECYLSPELGLFAVFVFGCLYEPIVRRVEISPYRIDIGDDLGIVWIFSLDHGRRIPCLDNAALRRLEVWIICAERELRRSRRSHLTPADQQATGKNRRGNDGARNQFISCHVENLLLRLLQWAMRGWQGKNVDAAAILRAAAEEPAHF